jgi:N-carbamoyl-L-amino-acid hydrolase
MAEVDGNRLIRDLRELATFGRFKTGVDRIAFSPADVEARRWLHRKFAEAGLTPSMDRFGNVFGSWADADRAILIGSHTDTVPRGGWLDGALGVIYALEIARTMRASHPTSLVGVDAISFQDEEGTYLPCLGSKSFCAGVDQAAIAAGRRSDGDWLSDALERVGLDGDPIRAAPERYAGFLEAHIEQGPRLIAAGAKIGIVTGFVGIRRIAIEARGRADHAGTTPMAMRSDAGLPLFQLAGWVHDNYPALGAPETVWNIGSVMLEPGAANVVSERAAIIVEFRDMDGAVLDRLERATLAKVGQLARHYAIRIKADVTARIPPTETDARLRAVLADAARDLGSEPMPMASGAGHDCMVLAKQMPAAMLFIPSIGGRSHHIEENTDEEDIVFGCRVLERAVEVLIAGPPS